MNCHNFQSIADELARGRLMDAAQREGTLAHADTCGTCAARLADGRALTAGLRTLSAQPDGREAPARVESALLAAFRQRHAAAAQYDDATQTPAPAARVVPLSSNRPRASSSWWFPRWAQGAAVAAASVLLVVGLYGIFREQPAPETRLAQTGAPKSEVAPERKQDAEAAAARPVDGGGATGVVEYESADVVGPERHEPEAFTPRRGNRATGARPNFQLAKFNGGARRPAATNASAGADASAPAEVATDFFPLMNGGQLAPGDAGHVIRVEVPRTALASFGLPVNADRAGGRVKADVLMGEDGMARAIRFVQ